MENKQLNFDAPLLSMKKSTNPYSTRIKTAKLELEEVTKMGNVPFVWERIPGTPINDAINRNLQIPINPPKLPPGRQNDILRRNSYQYDSDHSILIEILRASVYENRDSDSDSVDDMYSDTAETFESLSLNCSISGLTDHHITNSNSSDKQTGEFMMNRFIPAAKAAVIDTPQYVSKNRVVMSEPIQQSKTAFSDGRKSSNHRYYANLVLGDDYRYVKDENHAKRAVKTSRFSPHLCLKNSLCIVNNVAVLKPKSTVNDITRFTRKAYSGPIDKNCKDQNDKKRRHSGLLRCGDPKTNQSGRCSYSSDLCKTRVLLPLTPSRKPTLLRGMETIKRVNPEQGIERETNSRKPTRHDTDAIKRVHSEQGIEGETDSRKPTLHAMDMIKGVNSEQGIEQETNSRKPTLQAMDTIKRVHSEQGIEQETNSRKPTLQAMDTIKRVHSEQGIEQETNSRKLTLHAIDTIKIVNSKQGIEQITRKPTLGAMDKFKRVNSEPEIMHETKSEEVDGEIEDKKEYSEVNLGNPLFLPLPKSPADSWLYQRVSNVKVRNSSLQLKHDIPFNLRKPGQKSNTSCTK